MNSPIIKGSKLETKFEKSLSNKAIFDNWSDNFFAAVYLYENTNEFSSDEYITDLLENSLATGLTYQKNSEKFFQAIQILAKKYFKYKKYKAAENQLLLLRELSFDKESHEWINLYSIITHYKLNIVSILVKPQTFFDYFDEIDESSFSSYRSKIIVIQDFLNTLSNNYDRLVESRYFTDVEVQESFFAILDTWLSKYIVETKSQYYELLTIANRLSHNIYFNSQNDDFSIDVINLMVENEVLIDRIKYLEYQVQSLLKEVDTYKLSNQKNTQNVEQDESSNQKHRSSTLFSKEFHKHKILVYGATQIEDGIIYGLAKNIGFDKAQVDIVKDYSKNPVDFSKLRYNSKYSGVLFGPIPHSLPGKGSYSSVIEMMINEEGYPHVLQLKSESGQLKISKSSIREGLLKMKVHVETLSI